MICSRKLFKGNSYDLKLPFYGGEVSAMTVSFFTDGKIKVEKDLSQIEISGKSMEITLTSEDLEYLADGVLRYNVVYSGESGSDNYTTNTRYVVATPKGYSAQTVDELTEAAFESGLTACSGSSCNLTEGRYNLTADFPGVPVGTVPPIGYDGFNTFIVSDTGYGNRKYSDGFNSGYTNGYSFGSMEGFMSGIPVGQEMQRELLSSATFTSNGSYLNAFEGWSSVTVNVPQTGYPSEYIESAFTYGMSLGYASGFTSCFDDYCGDYRLLPLTFDILSSGTIEWYQEDEHRKDIEYSVNYDGIWRVFPRDGLEVRPGQKISFRGDNTAYSSAIGSLPENSFSGSTAIFNIFGNIMSLIDSGYFVEIEEFQDDFVFKQLFAATNVVNAENLILPVTNLTVGCYGGMFSGCTLLTKAPKLPARTLIRMCYSAMFKNCSSLNYINCLATYFDNEQDRCTSNWVEGVASSGTFVKHVEASWPTGNSGIPEGWTVYTEYD